MNTNTIVRFIHRLAAIVAISSFALVATAAEIQTHNPYTVRGFQIRTNLLPPQSASAYSTLQVSDAVGPTLFQELAPCRFVSTLDPDQYPTQWGGPRFQVNESRTYNPIGYLVDGLFRNPCSQLIPPHAVALAVRLGAYQPAGNGSVYLAPAATHSFAHPALIFKQGNDDMQEATVVLHDNAFVVTTADQETELTIDILGYFIKDELERGAKGDQGERGDMGPQGPAGPQGAQGLQGADGVAGAKGEKGADGVAGAKGDKGDTGADGVAGAKGDKGDRGEQGLQGERGADGIAGAKGDKGDRGEQGLQGERGADGIAGAKGDKGDRGEQGLQGERGADGVAGAKGDKGDRGEQGLQGERGADGVAGAKGDKGDKGDKGERGPQGPQGPQGLQGVPGTPGIMMSVGEAVFPPPGNITIHDGAIRPNSVILLSYIEVSNGNALGIASQSNGSFVASGSPNKPFKYIILTAN